MARARPVRMLWITAVWGACFIFIQAGLAYAPELWFATLRSVVAGVALLGYARLRGRPTLPSPSPTLQLWATIAAFGFFNATLGFGFMFAGVAGASVGVAAVLANAQPLLILLPAYWLFGEPAGIRAAFGLAVGFAGLVVIAGLVGGGSGAWLSLLAAVAITIGTLLARRLRGTDPVAVVAWHFIIGGGALGIVALSVEGLPAISWTPRFMGILAFLAFVATAAAFVAWFEEVQRMPLAALSAWTFLVPVFGLAFSVVFAGERPGPWTAAGLAVVLVSLWMVTRTTKPSRRSPDPSSDPQQPVPIDTPPSLETPMAQGPRLTQRDSTQHTSSAESRGRHR
jgi:probable blue pigment (indigoidine) exporter